MISFLHMMVELGQNLTLLIALTFLYSFVIQKLSEIPETFGATLQGILFGVIAVIGMQVPMHVADGINVDGRTVIVMLASPFAGNLAGLVAGGIVALFRLYLGGIGTTADIGAIITAMLIGMFFSKRFSINPGDINVKYLFGIASILTVTSLLWVSALPAETESLALLKKLALPVGVMYPLTAFLLGLSLAHEYRRLELIKTVRESESRFKGLFDNLGISIWNEDLSGIWDAFEGLRKKGISDLRQYLEHNKDVVEDLARKVKVIGVNNATLKLFGATSQKDIMGRIESTYGPNAMNVFVDELCAIWNGQKVFRGEATFRSLDGRNLSAFITFQIPTTKEGFKSVPVSLIDVTERRQIEETVRRSQKMEAVDQLTGGISHNFNNLLAIIQGNLELLTEMLPDNDKALKRIDTAQRSVTRGAEITNKLLSFSRKNAAQLQLTSMNMFIENLKDLVTKSLTVAIKVETRLAEDLWHVTIDPGDLENAILNLALNARDAMPDGGSLVIETSNRILDESYVKRNPESKAGNFVMISVSDTGIGMSEMTKEKILEPFFTTKEACKGTGLGLSMVYGFVQRSNGHLKIYSEVGKGTTICLYLPCAAEAQSRSAINQGNTGSLPRGAETILIVDDEEALLDVAASYLTELGYKTLTAENGKQALEVLGKAETVDLLFSDVAMSGEFDGYQLAVEAFKHRPSLKVLLTSGFSHNNAKIARINGNYLNHLSDQMLEKPYNMAQLAVALRDTLDKAS